MAILPKGTLVQHQRYTPEAALEGDKGSRYKSRAGKRLRLIQVDAEGREIEDVVPRPRKRAYQRSVLKNNIESKPFPLEPCTDDRNICVLYTNFTSEGDYINDHDYLISPYVRNKLFYHNNNCPVCVCLICDLLHQAKHHVNHMKTHKTVCQVCQIDFHNVFILNLHVRCHTTFCSECRITVTYADYIPHAQEHNKSLTLSNIDIAGEVVGNYVNELAESSQAGREKEPPSADGRFKTLTQLLSDPTEEKNSTLSTFSTSPNVSLRRSRRLIRSRRGIEYEEACIYDKTTRSFITSTEEEQHKLLEKSISDKQNTEYTNKVAETNISYIVDSENQEKEAISNSTTGTHNMDILNFNTFLTSQETSPEESNCLAIQQDNIIKTEPKKNYRVNKKRRKRFGMPRKKKPKNLSVTKNLSNNIVESKNSESVHLVHHESSNTDLNGRESDFVQITDQRHNPSKKNVIRRMTVDKDKCDSSKNTREKLVNTLKKELIDVRTYSKSSDNSDINNTDIYHINLSAEKEGQLIVGSTHQPESSFLNDKTETKDNRNTNKNIEHSQIESWRAQIQTKSLKAGKDIKKPQSPTLPLCNTIDSLRHSWYRIVPLETTPNMDNTKTSKKSTKTFEDSTKISSDGTEMSQNSTKSPKTKTSQKSTKLSQNNEKKSPLRGDLKMTFKSIKYGPFVWLTDIFKQAPNLRKKISEVVPETNSRALKTNERDTIKSQDAENSKVVSLFQPVEKEPNIPVDDNNLQDHLSMTVLNVNKKYETEKDKNETSDKNLEQKEDDGKKELKSDTLKNNTKARSSRSRGSSGLVEGLRGSERRYGYKSPKKPKKNSQNDFPVKLDTSQSNNEDLYESSRLKNEETVEASKSSFKASRLKNTTVNESSVLENVEA